MRCPDGQLGPLKKAASKVDEVPGSSTRLRRNFGTAHEGSAAPLSSSDVAANVEPDCHHRCLFPPSEGVVLLLWKSGGVVGHPKK